MGEEESLILWDDLSSVPLAPESDATEQAGLVGDDFHIFTGLEVDFLGVAAAEVQVVPVEEF